MTKKINHKISSNIGKAYFIVSMAIIVCVFAFILSVIFYYGADTISWHFLTSEPNPSALSTESGGIITPIIGTSILTIIGIVIAFPFALSTAIFLVFYSKKGLFKNLVKIAVDILSGVPTVVIALFALVVFTQPQMSFLSVLIEGVEDTNRAYGRSFLVSSITMAIMILPFITKSMEEALKSVPTAYTDASFALGASKWRTISKVALNSSRDGIVTGTILGMGRIIGDTAIVWLTLGGTLRMTGMQPWYSAENWMSTLQNTGSTLTSYIYFASPAGEGNSLEVAFGASVVLIVIIIILNIVATIIGHFGGNNNG